MSEERAVEAARRVLRNLRDPERGSDQISRDCDEAADTIEALLSMAEGDNSVAAGAGPSDLLPCPFCGFDADLHHVAHWWVSCSNCEVNTCYEVTEAEARAAWNRRGGVQSALLEAARRIEDSLPGLPDENDAHFIARALLAIPNGELKNFRGYAPSVPPDDAREAANYFGETEPMKGDREMVSKPKRTWDVWVAVTANGKPWIAHCRKRKKDLPRQGWVKKGECSDVVDLFPARATLTLKPPPPKS